MKMLTHHFLRLSTICLTLCGILSSAQNIGTPGNSNISIPLDPFLDYEEFVKDYSFVVCFKFHLIEEMLPQLFTEIAFHNMPCTFQDCNISLIDVAEATQLSRFTSEILADGIYKLEIEPTKVYTIFSTYNITSDVIENLLQTFGLTFSDIYKTFLDSLPSPSQTIPDVLNTLNVSVLDFMNAVAYGNDTVRLQVLFTGNYSPENVNAVLNITNKSSIDMLKLLPLNVIAGQLRKINANEFTTFVENLGVTTFNLNVFYKYLNITPINFLSHPSFIYIVSNFYDLLNTEEVLGTIVSRDKVVTSNKAKAFVTYQNQETDIVRNYVTFHAELVENPLVQYFVKNLTLRNLEYQSEHIGYVGINTSVAAEFPEISRDYNKTTLINCTYITKLPFGGVFSETVNASQIYLENNTVIMTKTNNSLYNLGSPLLCQDKLYGIAVDDSPMQIKFSTFMKKVSGTTTTPTTGQQPVSEDSAIDSNNDVGSSTTALKCNTFSIILALVVMKLLL